MVATAWVLAACATGVDSADDGLLGAGDSGATVEGSSGHDAAGSGGHDSAAAQEAGAQDAGTTGDDASETDDAPSIEEAATAQDSATTKDTGTTVAETGTGQDTGTTTGGQCPGTTKYDLEAVAVIASGTFTLCLSGVCGAGQCCFEGLSPGNVCVAQ
jgi:hypothetical protein